MDELLNTLKLVHKMSLDINNPLVAVHKMRRMYFYKFFLQWLF